MARFGHSLPKEKLGGLGVPSWLPDWLTGKDVRPIQGPVYIPPRGKAGGYRKELAADIARKAKDPYTQRDIYSAVQAGADFVPLMGEDVGIKETGEYWKKGDYINAAASGLGTVLGVAPVVGDVGGKLIKEGGKKLARGLGAKSPNVEVPVGSKVDVTDTAPDLGVKGSVKSKASNTETPVSSVTNPVAPKGLGGIRAYHGSPHSFEEFDISKIGTGEGAQAYGHGLYFAENEGVAKSYRDALADMPPSGDPVRTIAEKLKRHGSDIEAGLRRIFPDLSDEQIASTAKAAREFNPGSMYEVNIAADPEAFLDWDKPLSEQPEGVKAALKAKMDKLQQRGDIMMPSYVEQYEKGTLTGPQVYQGIGGQAEQSTEALKEAGIPGIKYLDQGSRATSGGELLGVEKTPQGWQAKIKVDNRTGIGFQAPAQMFTTSKPYATEAEARKWAEDKISSGSRNYVVFDPKIISIVKKYGLAAAIASGLISEEMGRQMQAQGEL